MADLTINDDSRSTKSKQWDARRVPRRAVPSIDVIEKVAARSGSLRNISNVKASSLIPGAGQRNRLEIPIQHKKSASVNYSRPLLGYYIQRHDTVTAGNFTSNTTRGRAEYQRGTDDNNALCSETELGLRQVKRTSTWASSFQYSDSDRDMHQSRDSSRPSARDFSEGDID